MLANPESTSLRVTPLSASTTALQQLGQLALQGVDRFTLGSLLALFFLSALLIQRLQQALQIPLERVFAAVGDGEFALFLLLPLLLLQCQLLLLLLLQGAHHGVDERFQRVPD